MSFSPLIDRLIDALRVLPGVGPRSAQRAAFHLLERDRDGARRLAEALVLAMDKVGHCNQCRTLSEAALCALCNSDRRDRSVLCVVENPTDVIAVDRGGAYNGLFFVLMGHLSPLDGIGPKELGLDGLDARLAESEVKELILATNPTVEGEATAHYIAEMARRHGVRVSRIAQGVPFGGELEFIDAGTLSQAIADRRAY
ncbi:MAG: recombination protein RecR [Gammaproteobacteria bacterium]|nr:recombination protein RecR [Gammaproteobacteria bacterium]MCP5136947.1 recombination protein RecR [Gammaproteobacteria bacterium]